MVTKKTIVSAIPFLMLFATGLSALYYNSVTPNFTEYHYKLFYILSNVFGYSIITNLIFSYLYFRKSFCLQTKLAVVGMLVMNLISIIFSYNKWVYSQIYDFYFVLIISVIIISTLNKWKD